MSLIRKLRRYLLTASVLGAFWVCHPALAQDPARRFAWDEPQPESMLVQAGSDLILVQATPAPPVQPAPPVFQPPPPTAGATSGGANIFGPIPGLPGVTAGAGASALTPPGSAEGGRAAGVPSGSGAGVSVVPAGSAAPVLGAQDVSALLTRSIASTGTEIQQRNPVVGDPRVRGFRIGQLVTYADGGYFFPARQDLDTAISKFDPRSASDVVVIKGPYSTRYGPGFSFIDIATLDTPRYQDGFMAYGRTTQGYQTNGARVNTVQSFWGGDANWGFRVTYDYRAGSDYEAGDGRKIPSSYNSQNFNYAIGYSFSEDARIEVKGFRLYQHDVEFAGQFFDITRLDTESYAVRFTLNNQQYWDRMGVDFWYNYTGADGNTQQGAKQAFLTQFLTQNFGRLTQDFSSTNFNESSIGYRTAIGWGGTGRNEDVAVQQDVAPRASSQLTAGTDLNYVRQQLNERIRLFQPMPDPNLGTPDPVTGLFNQNLGIPQAHLVDPGLFLDAIVPLTKRLTINSGARLDWVHTDSDNRFVSGNINIAPGAQNPLAPQVPGQIVAPGQVVAPVTGFDPIVFSTAPNLNDLSRTFPLYSAFVTADYQIDEHLSSYAKVGYSQRAPTITELYATGPFIAVLQQGLNRLVGDPNLKKEKLKQLDVGLLGNYDNIRFSAAGFYAWIDDYITFDQNRASGSTLTQVVFTNTDLATLAGGELSAETDLNARITPFVTVSYVQGRDRTHVDNRRPPNIASSRRLGSTPQPSDTEPLPGIPPLEARTGFRFHQASLQPRWSVEFLVRAVMGQNLVASSLNELPTSGFTLFNLRGFWQMRDGVLLTGGIENIGDKFYREHLDPRAGDQLFRPGTNAYAAVEVKY
jgi:iron complex outermembrane recepter protein